jgi:hypothetical protein
VLFRSESKKKKEKKRERKEGARNALAPESEQAPGAVVLDSAVEKTSLNQEKEQKTHPLQAAWNRHKSPTMPTWRETSRARKAQADVRLDERTDLDEWAAIIKRIADSSFCNGENERGWVADPAFLLKPDTATKVLEGKYDNRTRKSDPTKGVAPVADWSGVKDSIEMPDGRILTPEELERETRERAKAAG